MSIRCFVSSFTDFKTIGGPERYISAFIDQDFVVINNKLVAKGRSCLNYGFYKYYTKDIILEVSYSKDAKKFIVNVFWDTEWLDSDDMPITRYARDKAAGVCSLDKAEGAAIRAFQKESNEMLEGLIFFYEAEIKQVLKIED